MTEFIIQIGVFFLAALFHGTFGFGSAIIATPLLLLFFPPEVVVPQITLQSFVINFIIFRKMKLHLEWGGIRELLIWSLIGVPFGILILKSVSVVVIKWFIAFLIFSYVITRQIPQSKFRLNSQWVEPFLGLLAGALGAAFNINGPPVILYVLQKHWNAHQKKVTLAGYFLISGGIVILAHLLSGISNPDTFKTFLFLVPVTIIGTVLGLQFFRGHIVTKYENWLGVLLILLALMLVLS